MEMDELTRAWSGVGARLDEQALLLQRLQHASAMQGVAKRLRRMTAGQVVQLAIGLGIVFWAGGYWVDHLAQPHLVAYGVSLHLYGIGLLAAAIVQLARLLRLDYRAPVLDMQRQLLQLRRSRVRSERALLIAGCVAWVPLVFVAMHGFGFDLWLTRPAVVLWNLGAGLAIAAAVAWLTHRFRDTFERDAAGGSLREAEADLAELSATPRY